jgi:four helix bundle protein
MLRIYAVILDTIRYVRPTIETIEKKDADLGRQMRRAAASVALNTSEGMYSRLGNKKVRYHSALGSARETLACIETGAALGYIDEPDAEIHRRFNAIIGTLAKLV